MAGSLTIEELAVAPALDAPGGEDFATTVAQRNEIEREILGAAADTSLPGELLPQFQENPYDRKVIHVARRDGAVVGFLFVVWTSEPESRVTWAEVGVPPAIRGQGIGIALFDHLDRLARGEGRPVIQSGWGKHGSHPGPRLDAQT